MLIPGELEVERMIEVDTQARERQACRRVNTKCRVKFELCGSYSSTNFRLRLSASGCGQAAQVPAGHTVSQSPVRRLGAPGHKPHR